jgi:hypothetical protein
MLRSCSLLHFYSFISSFILFLICSKVYLLYHPSFSDFNLDKLKIWLNLHIYLKITDIINIDAILFTFSALKDLSWEILQIIWLKFICICSFIQWIVPTDKYTKLHTQAHIVWSTIN